MKIAHEAPLSIFDQVQKLTDYDYCLAHLFDENEEYRNKFLDAKAKGREIILDTSVFELGEAFDQVKYVEIIKQLQPTYYIVPDVLEDASRTCYNMNTWIFNTKGLPGKRIAVVQGKTYEELIECYKLLAIGADMIAISFDYSYYLHDQSTRNLRNEFRYMEGRIRFVKRLLGSPQYKHNPKPIHLLGCFLPQEFESYKNISAIHSLDTSNPIVHGMKHITYSSSGLGSKESVKLFTLINHQVTGKEWLSIEYNIEQFKKFAK